MDQTKLTIDAPLLVFIASYLDNIDPVIKAGHCICQHRSVDPARMFGRAEGISVAVQHVYSYVWIWAQCGATVILEGG